MEKYFLILLMACGLGMFSCTDLDIDPLSVPTDETWFTTESQFEMSVNDLYRINVWRQLEENWTDDEAYRNSLKTYVLGTVNGQTSEVTSMWTDAYKVIGRGNAIMDKLKSESGNVLSAAAKDRLTGEVLFVRACMYSQLVTLFGDVPYLDTTIDIETAFGMGRTPKAKVLKKIYADFDEAVRLLPVKSGEVQHSTKGAALAMKARLALYNEEWDKVIEATSECMNLGYELYPDYEELFLSSTHNTSEAVFSIARSVANSVTISWTDPLPRNNGGWAGAEPSWDLLAAYLCTDGLPIDESPLFDSHNPFENRDPRCAATIVPFGSTFLGFEYDPNPLTGEWVMNYRTGKEQKNNDNKAVTPHASYNGLIWKKGMDETCLQNGNKTEHDLMIIRYADVLLMYAEAMIEKGTIDDSVLKAINRVRARAYGVQVEEVGNYPAVTTTDQTALRTILRIERRMEFARENRRFMDMVRWKLCDKVLRMKHYGIFQSKQDIVNKMITPGHWFWAMAPEIDENGCADFSKLEEMGAVSVLAQRAFDPRQYLWPIPTQEILINKNLEPNNPGY